MTAQEKVIALWAINSERTTGLGKLLRTNFPINQIDLLQILANEGVSAKLSLKDIRGEILNELQLVWAKNITQKEMNYAIRVVLAHLKLKQKFELGVIAIQKEIIRHSGQRTLPLEILESNKSNPEEKVLKWKMITNWSENPNTSQWAKYDDISPKHFIPEEGKENYNVIGEFLKDSTTIRTIEVMLWTTQNVNEHIGEKSWNRGMSSLEINKGIKTLKSKMFKNYLSHKT